MIAYIREQGAKIRREGERLLVCGKAEPRILFSHKLEQILLFGNVHLTAQARSLLIAKRIDTVFLSANGSYRGRLVVTEGENVFLRKRQYDLLNDEIFQLNIAREIVSAKLHNQSAMLARLVRERPLPDGRSAIDRLKALAHEAKASSSVQSLRGIEGSGAELYFHYFAHAFHEDWGFQRRVRRPPTDPVNVVLSLVYTLLADRCHTACRLAGLDPFPAALHSLEYGRMSLPLDLIEEFRAVFADALTLSLFNRKMLKLEEFERKANPDEESEPVESEHENGMILCEAAFRKVLSTFAMKMDSSFQHPNAHQEMSYAEAVNWQARHYRDVIEGKRGRYVPILWH